MDSLEESQKNRHIEIDSLNRVPYSEIEHSIQPLDLLLFRGGDFVSGAIRFLQNVLLGNGSFSHVGIVVTRELMPWLKVLEPGEKYVWESTMSIPIAGIDIVDGVPDVESGKGKFGVQIRFLRDVIESYTNGESGALVAWGPLNNNPWENMKDRKRIRKTVRKLHKKIGCKTYELNLMELLASLFPLFRGFRDETEWVEDAIYHVLRSFNIVEGDGADAFYFCSELVAYIYKKLGIVDPSIKPHEVVPMDFLGYDKDSMVALVRGDPVILVP